MPIEVIYGFLYQKQSLQNMQTTFYRINIIYGYFSSVMFLK